MNLNEFYAKYGRDTVFTCNSQTDQYSDDWLDLYDTVENYKKEMINWFDTEHLDKDNPLSCVTQEHWYSMYLEKKRLEKKGIRMHHHAFQHIPSNGHKSNFVSEYHDGKYRVNMLRQYTAYDIKYTRDDKLIGQLIRKCNIDYYVLRAQKKNGLYICPNCGMEHPLQNLLDGCDYCNTKFDISAYNDKVASLNRIYKLGDARSNMYEYIILLIVLMLGILLSACTCLPILIPLVGIYIYMFKLKREINLNNLFKEKNPDSSFEEFIASLDSKIKSIHFAESQEDVDCFVKCDITPYLRDYQDVISCEMGKYKVTAHSEDETHQYINLMRSVRVLKDMGDHLLEGKGVLKMKLAKKKDCKLKNDFTLYVCKQCGASISLVEGGECRYCGNKMDYEAYDWVITEFSIADKKDEKKYIWF